MVTIGIERIKKGNLLPGSAILKSVAIRAAQVGTLLHRRRGLAHALRRGQDERLRLELAAIDRELAKYNIDIPAIQHRLATIRPA